MGYEEKREISAWKFKARIAPRAAHGEKEEEAEAHDQKPAEEIHPDEEWTSEDLDNAEGE